MTRERKELMKQMDELYAQENAEYELGCGFGSESIERVFRPYWDDLYEKWCATYGHTIKEHMDIIFTHQCKAYDEGRIPWSPCYGMSIL